MQFEWNEQKRQTNLRKHGLDFADAWEIFAMPMLVGWDDREDYSEDRWIGIGLLRQYVAVVVYIEQEKDSIRIISLRKATSRERRKI